MKNLRNSIKKNISVNSLRILKFTSIFLVVLLITSLYGAKTYAQAKVITLKESGITLEKLFKKIEQKSTYRFLYRSAGYLDLTITVNVDVKDKKINDVLDIVLVNTGIKYTMVGDNLIVIAPNNQSQITVTGKVVDKFGDPVIGVAVNVTGTSKRTVTDAYGFYSIQVATNENSLSFSYIGMAKKEIAINEHKVINMVMEEDVASLKEIVVVSTGYQKIPKERATGSFAIVPKEAIENQVTKNFVDILEGIAPGVLLNVTNEDGGNKTGIILRGIKSFQATQNALIVVDGFPVEGGLESINPADIESINVLQDAVATSIWGVRASNGVIVITTKRGSEGKPSVDFSSFLSVEMKPNLNDLQIADSKTMVNVTDHFARNGLDINLSTSSNNANAINQAFKCSSKSISETFRWSNHSGTI